MLHTENQLANLSGKPCFSKVALAVLMKASMFLCMVTYDSVAAGVLSQVRKAFIDPAG
jgi:hypothetical protein